MAKYLSLSLWLLFTLTAVLALFLMFKAGCTGDTKGGALGNPMRALDLETISLFPLLLSAIFAGIALSLKEHTTHPVAHGVYFALIVFIGLWFAGVQFEGWGVQFCF